MHRSTVNEMVNTGRLHGYRLGPHWYIRRSELDIFGRSYRRSHTIPRRRIAGSTQRYWSDELLRWLLLWNSATSDEFGAASVDLHIGNVRKYLVLGEQDGLVQRDEYSYWRLTESGEARARLLPAPGLAPPSDPAAG